MIARECLFVCISVPEDWLHQGRVAPQEEVELTFALKQQNVERLQELLQLVSEPDSQHYGTETHRSSKSETSNLKSCCVSRIHAFLLCPVQASFGPWRKWRPWSGLLS